MNRQPTTADRLGASLNLCFEHDKVVAASTRVLAAAADGAPAAELQELRRARDAQADLLNRFINKTRADFTPKEHSTLEARYNANTL